MDTSDLLSVILLSEVERESSNSFRFCSGDDFKRFDDPRNRLMLQTRIFALSIFLPVSFNGRDRNPNNCKINIIVAGFEARDILD